MFPFIKGDTAKPRGFLCITLKNPQSLRASSFQKGAQNNLSHNLDHEKIIQNHNLNHHLHSAFTYIFFHFQTRSMRTKTAKNLL
jgi:hypothetical protein